MPDPNSAIPDATGPRDAFANAQEIAQKAAAAGFDWEDVHGPLAKVEEELGEVRAALTQQASAPDHATRQAAQRDLVGELGDLLFAALNVCRLAQVAPAEALASCNARFVRRFRHMEKAGLPARGRLADVAQWDRLWHEAKRKEAL